MIPYYPRLHSACHVIADGPAVLLRKGAVMLRVPSRESADQFRKVLAMLDGRPAHQVSRVFGWSQLGAGIKILEELAEKGFLVESGEPEVPRPLPTLRNTGQTSGSVERISVAGTGRTACQARSELANAGTLCDHPKNSTFWLACYDNPQLEELAAFNKQAMREKRRWMPVFPLGGEIIAGPIIEPGVSGCFHCFELRRLGIAQAIPAERLYFDHLRNGSWIAENWSDREAKWAASYAAQLAIEAADGMHNGMVRTLTAAGVMAECKLVRHPACGTCGHDAPLSRQGQWIGWREAVAGPALEDIQLAGVLDDQLGLVGCARILESGTSRPEDATLFSAVARFAEPSPHSVTKEHDRNTGGYEPSPATAQKVAIIEGLERYCGIFPLKPMVVATYRELGTRAVCPTDLPLFSDSQYRRPGFPYQPFDAGLPLEWVSGFSLTQETERLAPLNAATYGPCKDKLFSESSNGVCARGSLAGAVYGGALELIERDAFMIFWLNRLSPPLLDLDRCKEGFTHAAAREMRRAGYLVYAANLTTDLGIPVVLALGVRDDGLLPALVVGAGSAPSPRQALDKAFKEALAATRWHTTQNWTMPALMQPEEVKSLQDHSDAYSHPDWLARASFLWQSNERQRIEEVPEMDGTGSPGRRLAALTTRLDQHGFETIGINLTTPDIESTDIRVARALVPGLQPIGFGQHAVRLGGRRLYEAPCRMGYSSTPLKEADLNPDPHCFP